jgi:hypothetical protein
MEEGEYLPVISPCIPSHRTDGMFSCSTMVAYDKPSSSSALNTAVLIELCEDRDPALWRL